MFQCRSGLWREDMFLEHVDVRMSFDMTLKHSISGISAVGEPHSDFAGSLYEYSSRQLSYDSDVLNAFEGIFGILMKRIGKERTLELTEVYGLPASFFDWAILWQPNKTARRRSGGWPSWSWCGWTGQVSMLLSGLNTSELEVWLCDHTWIKWIVYDSKGQPLIYLLSNSTHQQEVTRFPPTNCPQTIPAPAIKVKSLKALSEAGCGTLQPFLWPSLVSDRNGFSPLLHFNTLSVHFRLAPTEFVSSDNEPADRSYIICDALKAPCGTVWLNTAWHYDPSKSYEFLILSDALRRFVVKNEFLPIESESEWGAYHVMMIHWQENGDIAERMAMGKVYREAIDNAVEPGMQWKEIWLR